jgi:ABC-type bacteriocin/lantibiotic exporter with double-glycine peptidase domain
VVIDNMAALRWRLAHANPDDAVWSNRCDDDGVLAQRTGATCAPASGAMLLYRYGISVSEGAIAYRAGTSAFGTDEYELADGIQSMLGGTAGRAEATHETAEEVIAGGAPCIVYIDTPLGCHAVLLEAVVNGQLDLVDPLGGVRETISSEEFATVFRGVVIRIGGLPRRR